MHAAFAHTPKPPYYAVIFTSLQSDVDREGYALTAGRMNELAAEQPGFLGAESVRGKNDVGITVAYWDSLENIQAWRNHAEHTVAREAGRQKWYRAFFVRIAHVERAYSFEQPTEGDTP